MSVSAQFFLSVIALPLPHLDISCSMELSITTKDTGMPGEKLANQEAPNWEIFVIFTENNFEGNMSY